MDVKEGFDGITNTALEQTSGLLSLISPIVAGVILQDAKRCSGDFAVAVPAIVQCADLSGFSIAGAALTRSEARGAEELRDIVNAVFGQVAEAINLAGGQILQFSGDVVTAAWPIDGAPEDQTLCAISAGLALQKACSKLSVPGIPVLNLRVSVALG